MAEEVKVMFFGSVGAAKIQNALKRILEKVKRQEFNGLEVTQIVARRFLGAPYVTVSAHSRHVQQAVTSTAPWRERRPETMRNGLEVEPSSGRKWTL